MCGLGGCATAGKAGALHFAHGVASGDPGPDRVVIWTRLDGATTDGFANFRQHLYLVSIWRTNDADKAGHLNSTAALALRQANP